jgi:hypothetical protein
MEADAGARRTGIMRLVATCLALSLALAPVSAFASEDRQCPNAEQRALFQDFQDRLSRAKSPEAARREALSKIRLGHKAIRQASRLVSDEQGIAEAQSRLDKLEQGVLAARTQEEVAAQFGQLGAQAMNCHYDTVEIVIIVVGFVLGILPGLLFLILFC